MSNKPTTDRLVEVLDSDREAYAAVYQDKAPKYADQARAGDFDTTPLVQAFARHRIAATQSLSTDLDKAQQRIAELEEIMRRIRNTPSHMLASRGTSARKLAESALNQTKESGND